MLPEIPESELREEFIRPASGPGGQHLNRTANAVRLAFNFMETALLSDNAKARIAKLGGARVSGDEIVIVAKEYRSLQANRNAARVRLRELLESASKEPRKRRPTKVSKAQKEQRLQTKAKRSTLKSLRSKKIRED